MYTNTLRRGLAASANAPAPARSGVMQFSSGRATVAPAPRRKCRRFSSHFWPRMLLIGRGSCGVRDGLTLLEQVGQHERFHDGREAIVGGLAPLGDPRQLVAVGERRGAAEGERGQLVDE